MTATIGVLGPGAVGGALAVRLSTAGRVICVGTPASVAAIRSEGLRLDAPDGVSTASPEATELLGERVDLLLVTVKAQSLLEALERVEVFAVADGVVLPLMNGLEHPESIRRRLGPRVAAGSISRFEGYREGLTRIVQTTATPVVTAASDDLSRELIEAALTPLRLAGIEVVVADHERAVLWEKAARLGPLAAATALTQRPVGELRADPEWHATLAAAVEEACAVAAADGVDVSPAEQWTIIDAMPASLTTSAARDVANGRPSELDAIAGAIVRAGTSLGVPTPTLGELLRRVGGR
jgi:2-dehydropantoate 2-reductase